MQNNYTTECGSGNGSKDIIRALKGEIQEDRARLDSPMIVRFDDSGEHDFTACTPPARLLKAFDPEEVEFLPGFTTEERAVSLELWERNAKRDILRGLSKLGYRRGSEDVRRLVAARLTQIEALFHGAEPIEHNLKAKAAHYVKLAKDLRDEISRMGGSSSESRAVTKAPIIIASTTFTRTKEYKSPSRRASSGRGGGGDGGDDSGGSGDPEPPAATLCLATCFPLPDVDPTQNIHTIATSSEMGWR
jgi:hypothetical protein